MKSIHFKFGVPFLGGVIMTFFPLVKEFHFESAFLAAIVGCIWAAVSSTSKPKTDSDFFSALKILGFILLMGIPPFFVSLFSGCLTFDGIGFWLLLPAPSVFLGFAIGRLYRKFSVPKPSLFAIVTLLVCGVGIWMIEFFNLPQVYLFNHVWGTWPGPIYDETLQITESLLFFRWITFLWIIILWILPDWTKNLQNKIITFLSLFCLLFSYLNLDEMGIITPRDTLKSKLSNHVSTTHFDLYFDEEHFSQNEIDFWTLRHEFHFNQIIEELEIDWPEGRKIESYLYANAWQKKKLVGAKFTSYVPIWLEQDQLHIAKQQLDGVLKHELVHAISKQFGNKLFNGSWSIGMIEGVAEAIAGDASPQSTLDQIIASEEPYATATEMQNALSVSGFYSSASSISYTTAGSFTRYLLKNYPVQNFKEAYSSNNFEQAFAVPFDELVQGWHQHLDSVKVDSLDRQVSEFIFSRRSLFQKDCPHNFSEELKLWDEYNLHTANQESTKALESIEQLYELDINNKLVKREWIRQQLLHEKYATALYAFDDSDSLLTLQLLKADALFLNGDINSARIFLDKLNPKLDSTNARNFKYSYELRSDSLNWNAFLTARYRNIIPNIKKAPDLNYPNRLLITSTVIELEMLGAFWENANSLILSEPVNEDWFDIYENMIEQLVFSNKIEDADVLITALYQLELRDRYTELLVELKEWRNFVSSQTQTN